jgi:hypothetical protein
MLAIALSLLPSASAAPCDGKVAKELRACLASTYAYTPQIEATCAAQEEGYARWKCRQAEYAARGVGINPPILQNGAPPSETVPTPVTDVPIPVAAEPLSPTLEVLDQAGKALNSAMDICADHEPTPIDFWAYITNPRAVAVARNGEAWITAGEAAATLGVGEHVGPGGEAVPRAGPRRRWVGCDRAERARTV